MCPARTWPAFVALIAAVALGACAAAAAAAPPAVVAGTTADGDVTFRLEGRRLLVTIRRPLATKRPRGPWRAIAVCGDNALGEQTGLRGSFVYIPFTVRARTRHGFALRSGVRTIRVRLGTDVAARANWCGLSWHGLRRGFAQATMELRRGSRPGCAPVGEHGLETESETVVVQTAGAGTGDGFADFAARGCLKPDGPWILLDTGTTTRYMTGIGLRAFTTGGSWVAWLRVPEDGSGDCTLWRRDLAGGEKQQLAPPGADGASDLCKAQPELAVSADGTVTWREDGVLRSASV